MTTCPPETAPVIFHATSALLAAEFWMWSQLHVWNDNKQIPVTYGLPSLLKPGDTLGMTVFPNGELHVYYNDQDVGTPFKIVPVDRPIYGVIDVKKAQCGGGSYRLGMKLLCFDIIILIIFVFCTEPEVS